MLLDIWTFLWILVCLTILISILESIYRRVRERQLRMNELEFQRQMQAQQYHVYTLQPLSNSTSALGSPLSQQQQEYIHEQQELKAANDLPPKYEDVVKTPYTGVPVELVVPSSSSPSSHRSPEATVDTTTITTANTADVPSTQRY